MLPPRPTRRRLQRSHDFEAATGLRHPLPTLRTRRCRRPRKARFRLAGWPLPGEGRTLRIAAKGFRALSRRPPFQGLPCRKLGCIADDFTGGTDLAGMLVKSGMRTVQMIGVPMEPLPDDIEAVVIALKSRTTQVNEAIAESLVALHYL